MAIAGAILLSLYLCGLLFAMLMPPKQHDPQRGMAVGCLMIVAAGVAGVLGVLILGEIYAIRGMVIVAFVLAVLPLAPMTAMGVHKLVTTLRK